MTLTRDSLLWWLVLFGAVVTYLVAAQTPPTAWGYSDWLKAASAGIAWLSGYLKSSPLPLSYQAQKTLSTGDGYRDIPAPSNPPPPPAEQPKQ